jgi:hypothetical protein
MSFPVQVRSRASWCAGQMFSRASWCRPPVDGRSDAVNDDYSMFLLKSKTKKLYFVKIIWFHFPNQLTNDVQKNNSQKLKIIVYIIEFVDQRRSKK